MSERHADLVTRRDGVSDRRFAARRLRLRAGATAGDLRLQSIVNV
jgi:hypothetical protein